MTYPPRPNPADPYVPAAFHQSRRSKHQAIGLPNTGAAAKVSSIHNQFRSGVRLPSSLSATRPLPSAAAVGTVARSIASNVSLSKCIALAAVGWAAVPLAQSFYSIIRRFLNNPPVFRQSYTYHVANNLGQLSRVLGMVYAIDVAVKVLPGIGVPVQNGNLVTETSAKVLLTIWAAWRLSKLKRFLLSQAVHKKPDNLGKASVYNRFLDGVIAVVTAFFLMDYFAVPMTRGVRSIFTVGGVGTVAFTLASKELASQILGGIALGTQDKFFEGDSICLNSGGSSDSEVRGTVERIGWMDTIIRASDEQKIRIPNSDVAKARLSNISRIKTSQVTQTLRFSYKDIEKIPAVCDEIKDKIRVFCPSLILDGSRPFRVHWTDFKEQYLEVIVDCHFNVPLGSAAYYDNRQNVLLAIAHAAKEEKVEFAYPTYAIVQEERS